MLVSVFLTLFVAEKYNFTCVDALYLKGVAGKGLFVIHHHIVSHFQIFRMLDRFFYLFILFEFLLHTVDVIIVKRLDLSLLINTIIFIYCFNIRFSFADFLFLLRLTLAVRILRVVRTWAWGQIIFGRRPSWL